MRLLVKLNFKRGLAVSSADFGDNERLRGTVHSDTLFSGLANQWVKIPAPYSIGDLISKLNSDTPPFQISSAFPCFGIEYYLPTPRGTDELYMDLFKDLPYLELSDFLKLANGQTSHLGKIHYKNPVNKFVIGFTSPRVTIDRLTNVTNPYEAVGWTMPEGGGLYFLIDLKDETIKDTLELCIRLLGDAGLGSDRNVGYGVFHADIIPIADESMWSELFLPKEHENVSYCALSLCYPPNNNEAKQAVSYDIVSRSGWILSSSSLMQMKRRECKMFSEGSLFRSPIKGSLADVTPNIFKEEHNVYRYGLAMMVAGTW